MNHQRKIMNSYINSYNDFDIEGMTKYLTDDVVFENISDGKVNLRTDGLIAFKEQAEAAKQYFEERRQTITSWEFDQSKVVITIDYAATVATDLPNGMKKGDTLKLEGSSEFEFKGDNIVRITDIS